jgi:hypothetical protein
VRLLRALVSIYLQSVRGLNLAWALTESGRVGQDARVAVVGGGFAGLTTSAGRGRKGVQVTLFEHNRELLQTQRNNRVRSIHPHIHEWPCIIHFFSTCRGARQVSLIISRRPYCPVGG